jgi:hypothetical protein
MQGLVSHALAFVAAANVLIMLGTCILGLRALRK